MKNNLQQDLKIEFESLKKELLKFIDDHGQKLPEDAYRVYLYILKKMDSIIANLNIEAIACKKKYAELSRAIIELPPSVIDPALGGKIINAEKQYLNSQWQNCNN